MIPEPHTCSFRTGKTWLTFTSLEERLNTISRHVAFSTKNSKTWSEELASFLILSGSAVDTFFRNLIMCPYIKSHENVIEQKKIIKKRKLDGGISFWTVEDYREALDPIYELSKNKVQVPFGLDDYGEVTPFQEFSEDSTPKWWSAYNKMKHNYYNKIKHATLDNSINCLAGLLVLNSLHKCSQEYLIRSRIIRDKWNQTHPPYLAEMLKLTMTGYIQNRNVKDPYIQTSQFVFKLREKES